MRPALGRENHFRSSRRLAAIGVAVIAVTILASALTIWDLRANAIETSRRGITNLGVVLAEQASRSVQAVDLVLREAYDRVLATGVTTPEEFRRRLATEEMYRFLADRPKNLPQAAGLSLIDDAGKVINLSTSWPPPPVDTADRDYFRYLRDHDDGGVFLSAPVRNRVSGSWQIYRVRRVDGPDARFLGLVLGAIELQYYEEFYNAITLPGDWSVSLARRDGTVLARYPHVESALGQKLPDDWPWFDRVEAGGGTFRAPGFIDHEMRLISVHPLQDLPFVVTVTVAESTILADWRRQSAIIAVGTLCTVLGFAVLFHALGAQFHCLEQSEASLAARNAELEASRTRLERQTGELVRAAEQLRGAKEEAEAASRTKSQFLANMSHELRTPLNAILGFAEIIRDQVAGLATERRREYAEHIHDAGRHLLGIIGDVLDLSKVEVGRLELHKEWVTIDEIVRACRRLVAERAREGGVAIEEDLPAALPPVFADRQRLKQIVLNLLSNAVKFTPAGGRVVIAGAVPSEGGILLSIADTGIGMRQEDIPVALAPFQQIEADLSRRYEGTGLGLALAKTLTELHGGTLEVESELGRGTVVRLRLPALRVGEAQAAP
jgi:signal transduction histidine kinase